jgi:ankyrin repeat protein
MWASRNGHERAVRLLLARGARHELRGQHKRTALHTAAANAHAGVVAQLCAAHGAGAVVAMCNFSGDTPLALVSAREQEGRERVRACERGRITRS